MPSLKEIKKAVSSALKKPYPKTKVYGVDTVESYSKPCFFVYVTQTFSEATKNAIHKNVEIEIDYIQNSPDENKAMDFFEKMENTFCQKLVVGFSEATKNAIHKNVEIEIDYIQNSPDENKAMDFFEKMENTFCQKLVVGARHLSTSELFTDFAGEHSNIPVFTFDVEFWDEIKKEPDNSALMGDFRIKTEVKR